MAAKVWMSTLSMLNDPSGWPDGWLGGLEVFAEGPRWWDPEKGARALAPRLGGRQGGLSVHAPFWELNLASPYPERARWSLDVLRRVVRVAAAWNAEFVVVHTHDTSAPLFDRPAAQRRVIAALRDLASEAAALGTRIAVENIGVGEFALFDRQEFVALFDELPGAVALLDVGHAHLNGWPVADIITALGGRLHALHLHDNHGQADEHLPVGAGSIDWEPVWHALRKLPADPVLILEYAPATPLQRHIEDAARVAALLADGRQAG